MIAIHTALTVFNKSVIISEGGIYPYRRIAYFAWIIWPLLSASLAFINPLGAYVSSGTLCYLPVRPFWYRLALSWIPRYVIFLTIISLYAAIYVHVKRHFNMLSSEAGSSLDHSSDISWMSTGNNSRKPSHCVTEPAVPLIPEDAVAPVPSNSSVLAVNRGLLAGDEMSEKQSWQHGFSFGHRRGDSLDHEHHSYGGHIEPDTIQGGRRSSTRPMLSPNIPISSSVTQFGSAANSRRSSKSNDRFARDRRAAIMRQLKLMFIYPLFYMIMWLAPFISHCLSYSDHYAMHPSFGLRCMSSVALPIQCFVDCIIFTFKEKPWRHIPGSDGTFLGSFRCRKRSEDEVPSESRNNSQPKGGPGRTPSEMIGEARNAYARREQELGRAKHEAHTRKAKRKASLAARGGKERTWWDEEEKKKRDRAASDAMMKEEEPLSTIVSEASTIDQAHFATSNSPNDVDHISILPAPSMKPMPSRIEKSKSQESSHGSQEP
jgi:G protein-coupled receptor GPR1